MYIMKGKERKGKVIIEQTSGSTLKENEQKEK